MTKGAEQHDATAPLTREQRMQHFVDKLKNASTKAMEEAWHQEVTFLASKGYKGVTIKQMVTLYRNAIKAHYGLGAPALQVVNMSAPMLRKAVEIAPQDLPRLSTGRTAILVDRIDSFVSAAIRAPDARSLRSLWKEERDHHQDKSLNTRVNYVSKYRAALRASITDGKLLTRVLSIVKAPQSAIATVTKERLGRITDQHYRTAEFTHWKETIARATELLDGEALEIGYALLFLTGRRPYEIFCTGSFMPAKIARFGSVEKYWLRFSGQAKTRALPGTRYASTFRIPCLAPAKDILAAHHRYNDSDLGAELADATNDNFQLVQKRLRFQERFRDLFGDLWPDGVDCIPYSARALYAEITHFVMGHQAPHLSKNAWYAKALGHTQKDIETSLAYMRFHLPETADAAAQAVQRTQQRTLARTHKRDADPQPPHD